MDWYYKDGEKKVGPLSDDQMKQLASEGKITPDTSVWNELTSKWLPYGKVAVPSQTPSAKTHVPAPQPETKPEETAEDLYEDPDARHANHGSDHLDPEQTKREREATATCAVCGRDIAWSRIHSTPRGLVCDECLAKPGGTEAPPNDTPPPSKQPGSYRFEFTGYGGEYFRIWIVNLFLSIITLGIYSAWAKVRKNKYFYRNMRVAGSSLDYHGNPVAILKGRIIAFILIMGLKFSPNIHIALYFIFLAIILGLLPWLITRALAFRLHNTSWRGIRFRYHGTTGAVAKVLFIYGMLIPISFGFCYPLFYQRIRTFIFNNASFGTTKADLRVGAGPVYRIFIQTIGLAMLVPIISVFVVSSLVRMPGASVKAMAMYAPIAFVISYLVIIIISYPFFQARMTNLIWNNASIGPVRFDSTQRVLKLAGILVGNFLLTLVTLGLYWPWAAIRLARYRAETMELQTESSLDAFATDTASDMTAAGDEISDALGFDLSF